MSYWCCLKNHTPEMGKFYDITNDNPFESKVLNVQNSVKCDYVNKCGSRVVFLMGDEPFSISKKDFANWWFCDAEAEEIKDPVNKPSHYTTGVGFECIECMQMILTREQYVGFLLGNAFKYIWRHKLKGNPKQDLEKADWYLQRAVEITGGTENTGILIDKVASLMNELEGE